MKGIKKQILNGTLFITTSMFLINSYGKTCELLKERECNQYKIQGKPAVVQENQILYDKEVKLRNDFNYIKDIIIKNVIEKYSKIYNLNYYMVYSIAKENTNNFDEKLFETFNFKKNKVSRYNNLEEGVIEFIRDIKYNPQKYGLTIDQIYEDLYIKENTIRESVYNYSKIYGVDKELILAIEMHESGNYECSIATVKNNPGALRYSKEFNSYENIEQGIIEHIRTMKYSYINRGATTPERISIRYCNGSSQWINRVNSLYYTLKNDEQYFKFYDEREIILEK